MREPQFKQNQNIWEIDVPEDNSCLFWAVALAYLIPVKDNDFVFETRLKNLFGEGSLQEFVSVKNWIRSYNPFSIDVPDETLGRLIKQQLHQRVVYHMGVRNMNRFAAHIASSEGDFDDNLSKMKDASTWEGEAEIRAMSELLDCRIQVSEDEVNLRTYGEGTHIQLFHVGEPNPDHYLFALEKGLGDNYQSLIKSVATSEHKAASTSAKQLGTKEEPPHKRARYDLQASRAVVQGPQLKQPCIEKESFKPQVESKIQMSVIKGRENAFQANVVNQIAVQRIYQGHEDQYTPYFSEVEKHSIDFKKDVIGFKPFLEGKKQILNLSFTGKDTLLGYITVGIIFKKIKGETNCKAEKTAVEVKIYNYTRTNSLRMFSLHWLLQHDEVLEDFKYPEHNLLVIECTHRPGGYKANKKFRKLFDILEQWATKKVIFIGVEDEKQAGISSSIRTFFKKKLGERYTEKAGDEIKFSDLTDGSKYKVLKKEIFFQGQRMPLRKLMEIDDPDNLSLKELDKLNKVLDTAALLELITISEIEIGSAPPGWHDQDTILDEETYIPRSFNRRITYADKALTKNVGDLFAVCDIEEADFKKLIPENEAIQLMNPHNPNLDLHKRFILLASITQNYKDQEEVFKKLCSAFQENFKDKVIHWLKKEKEELVWQRTWSNSQTYVYGAGASKEANNKSAPSETTEVPDKIVVVIDEPGMGKSTTLTHVSEQARKVDKWVIKINLKDHEETIANQSVKDDLALLDLLAAIDTQGLKATVARRLLAYRLEQHDKIVLLLDGFDEISSNCQDKVLQLLQFLKNERRAEKVWITARLHTKTKLENALSIFSYRFQPFNAADQQKFLKRFWTMRLISEDQNLKGAINEDCLVYYAEKLFNLFSSPKSTALKKTKTIGEVIGIPLLTRMLAEIFFNDFKKFYDMNKGNMKFALGSKSNLRTLNLMELYEEFIKAKYYIYFKKKISVDRKLDLDEKQILMDFYTKTHQYLAFNTLFSEQIESFLEAKKNTLSNDKLTAIGIIKDFKHNVSHFIHPTFTEYFVADLLYMRLSEDKHNPVKNAAMKEFLQLHLFKDKNTMIRLLLDYKLAKSLPMHVTALNGEEENLTTVLQKDAADRQLDSLKRTPLHVAAAYGHKTMIKALLVDQTCSMYIADELKQYPLSYAVLSEDQEVFRLILSKCRFASNETEASKKILFSTIQMVVERSEIDMLKLVLSSAYVQRSQVTVMLEANNYVAFQKAVQRGDYKGMRMMDILWEKANEKQKKEMMTSIDAVAAFQQAVQMDVEVGIKMMDSLWKKADEKQKKEMMTSIDAVAVFQQAVQRGGVEGMQTMNYLWDKADEKQKKEMMTSIDAVAAFQQVVQMGDVGGMQTMNYLWEKADEKQKKEMMTNIDAVAAFQQAVQRCDDEGIEMMDSLWEKADEKQKKEMITSIDAVAAFQQAVQRDDNEGRRMMNILWKKADEKQQKEMLAANNYAAFQQAVQGFDYEGRRMMDSLWEKADETQKKEMLAANNYAAFQQAVQRVGYEGGRMIDNLWKKADEKQKKEMMTSIDAVAAFHQAVQRGGYEDIEMMDSLWEKADEKQQKEMLAANNYAAFQQAVQRGGYEVKRMIDSLWKKADEKQKKEMMTSIDAVAAFHQAVQRGGYENMEMMDSLWEKADETQKKEMLASNNYAAFQQAVQRGNYEGRRMMDSLWEKADETQKKQMLAANNYGAFQQAVQRVGYEGRRMIDSLWKKADEKQKKEMMTSIDTVVTFQQAVQRCDDEGIEMMNILWENADEKQKKEMMTNIDTVVAFQQAVQRCDDEGMEMMDSLWEKADEKQKKEMMTNIDAVAAFQQAVQRCDDEGIEMMDSLWEKADEKQQKEMMTSIDAIAAFHQAVQRGGYESMEMMDSLWEKADEKQKKEMMTSIDTVGAFQQAVQRCDDEGMEMMDSLWKKADEKQKKEMMTSIDAVAAFHQAVQRGGYEDMEMMNNLWEKADEKQQKEMLAANNYAAFQQAVQRGGYEGRGMMDSLWEKADEKQKKEMMTSIDTVVTFQQAVQRCDDEGIEMMYSLWEKADEKQ